MFSQTPGIAVTRAISGLLALSLAAGWSARAFGADGVGGGCCADLEARITELEETVVRAGPGRLSVRIGGQVHRVLTLWDDGAMRDVYESDTSTWASNFRVTGVGRINPDWRVGYRIEISPRSGLSSNLSQVDAVAERGGLRTTRNFLFVENDRLGRVSLGLQPEGNDGASTGGDFSGADAFAGIGLYDSIGGFFLRRRGAGGLSGLVPEFTWGDVSLEAPGDGASDRRVLRYESPVFASFKLTASWGEEDDWGAALFFDREVGDFRLGASVGYGGYTSATSPCRQRVSGKPSSRECNTYAGSVGFIHNPTGINATYATGTRNEDFHAAGDLRFGHDDVWHYAKVGIYRQFFPLGHTGLFAEYYRGAQAIEELYEAGTSSFAAGDVFIRGAITDFYGIGLFQEIDSAAMQAYISYRNYWTDLDAIDPATGGGIAAAVERFQAVVVGMKIEF